MGSLVHFNINYKDKSACVYLYMCMCERENFKWSSDVQVIINVIN